MPSPLAAVAATAGMVDFQMSIKIMSAIFETEFFDLQDAEGNTSKASTLKLVLLALADHANDEGEGAYPGLSRMEKKTALSRQCIINAYDTLKHHGIINLEGKSKWRTNTYTINTQSFPRTFEEGKSRLLVNPVDLDSKPGLPEIVNPVDPNHPLTVKKPSLPEGSLPLDWKIATNGEITDADLHKDDPVEAVLVELEMGLRVNIERSLRNQQIAKRIVKDGRAVAHWLEWCKSDPWRREHTNIYRDLAKVWGEWPQAFEPVHKSESQDGGIDRGRYV